MSEFDPVAAFGAVEDPVMVAARSRAPGPVPSAEVGSLLAWVAATTDARNAVEVGSAAGLTGLWLLRGLPERGVLTSIESDPHAHELARQAYDEAGATERVRTILGDPLQVLERLSDASYGLLLVQHGATDELLTHARRLLRPGGAFVARVATKDAGARVTTGLAEGGFRVAAVLPLEGALVLATRDED